MMDNRVSGLSGMAKIEEILSKIEAIREKFSAIQDNATFRSALTRAQERHSTDGKSTPAADPRPAPTSQAGERAEVPIAPVGAPDADHSMEKRLMETLRRELPKHKVPPDLALAVMQAESNFNPSAVSPKGAVGVMQLMPDTAAGLGVDADDLSEPEVNIPTGLQYLSQLLTKYGGNERMALAAYNAGPGAVSKYGGVPPFPETRDYIKKVLEYRQKLNDGATEP